MKSLVCAIPSSASCLLLQPLLCNTLLLEAALPPAACRTAGHAWLAWRLVAVLLLHFSSLPSLLLPAWPLLPHLPPAPPCTPAARQLSSLEGCEGGRRRGRLVAGHHRCPTRRGGDPCLGRGQQADCHHAARLSSERQTITAVSDGRSVVSHPLCLACWLPRERYGVGYG